MPIDIKPGEDEKSEIDRDGKGRFLTGHKAAGPGRPKGSRHKLTEDLLAALQQDFAESGTAAIVEMRQDKPAEYVKCLVSLLPKDVNLTVSALDEMTETQLVERMRQLDAILAPFLAAADPGGIAGAERDSRGAGTKVLN